MRSTWVLLALLGLLVLPASRADADAKARSTSYTRSNVGSAAAGCEGIVPPAVGVGCDCGSCATCCPRILPALLCTVERFLEDIFRCGCCDGSKACKAGPKACKAPYVRPYLCKPLPLCSIRYGCYGGCGAGKAGRGCDPSGGDPWLPAMPPNPFLDDPEPPSPSEAGLRRVWDTPPSTRLLSAPRPAARPQRAQRNSTAPRRLNVATAVRLENENLQESEATWATVINTSSETGKLRIPPNPLRPE